MNTYNELIKEYKKLVKKQIKFSTDFPQVKLDYQDGLKDGMELIVQLLDKYKYVFDKFDEVDNGTTN